MPRVLLSAVETLDVFSRRRNSFSTRPGGRTNSISCCWYIVLCYRRVKSCLDRLVSSFTLDVLFVRHDLEWVSNPTKRHGSTFKLAIELALKKKNHTAQPFLKSRAWAMKICSGLEGLWEEEVTLPSTHVPHQPMSNLAPSMSSRSNISLASILFQWPPFAITGAAN